MRLVWIVAVSVYAAACSSSTEARSAGAADISGRVVQATDQPLALSSVAIRCANGAISATAPTDSTGRFAANLVAPEEIMASSGGSITCHFVAPDATPARIAMDVVVHFAPVGVPHALQIVTLQE